VDLDGRILAGHARCKAAEKIGLETVPTLVLPLRGEKADAYVIVDNKLNELSTWDEGLLVTMLKDLEQSGFDLELTGFDLAEVKDLFGSGSIENAHEDNFDEDGAASEITEPITRTGDIWLIGKHRLLCEDSTKPEEIAKLMDGKLADLVVTDPPYNVNYEDLVKHRIADGQSAERKLSSIANDNLSNDEFYQFLLGFYKTAYANMKGGAPLYVFHSSKESVNFTLAMKAAGFKVAQVLTWVKNHFTLGRQDYQWQTENILYGWKEQEKCSHYFIDDRTNASLFDYATTDFKKLTKAEAVALLEKTYSGVQSDSIRCDKPVRSPDHPTMKPLLLVAKLICNSSREGDIILESFGGSGSTLIAAGQLNRICYACELDARYCDVIVKRAKLNFPDDEIRLIRNGKEVDSSVYASLSGEV
jgi:DNA modification methylase